MRLLISSLLIFLSLTPQARALTADDLGVRHAYVVDYDTGTVLLEKDADVRMPTASMSKVMTMMVVFDALKQGRLKLTDTLPVSEKAWKMQGSKMFVHVGDQVAVEDLIRGVIIQSGNDATIVLAEGLAGTEQAFATRMNEMAVNLGMTNSHFTNASGWPDPDHYSTAKDLVTMAKALIQNYPEYYKYYAETAYTYNKIKQGNRNPLLYRNLGADGIKTGHTTEAGFGLIGSGVQDGRRVVLVVAGLKDMQERADVSTKVLSWALQSFVNLTPYADGRPVLNAPVVLGQSATVPVTVGQDFQVTVPRLGDRQATLQAEYTTPLVAPVRAGDKVGMLNVRMAPDEPTVQLPLVAASDVPAMGFFARTYTKAKMTFFPAQPE